MDNADMYNRDRNKDRGSFYSGDGASRSSRSTRANSRRIIIILVILFVVLAAFFATRYRGNKLYAHPNAPASTGAASHSGEGPAAATTTGASDSAGIPPDSLHH